MLLDGTVGYWSADWLWGLPLIAVSVVVHAAGLSIIAICLKLLFDRSLDQPPRARSTFFRFPVITGLTTLLLTALHGMSVLLWALAYVGLGAVPDFATAVYHSLLMMTTIGSNVSVEPHWKLLGGLQAIGGWLLFGLSTAFLFAIMERAWPVTTRHKAEHAS